MLHTSIREDVVMLAESEVVMISLAVVMRYRRARVKWVLKGSGIKINDKERLAEITFDSRREPRRRAPQHLMRGDDGVQAGGRNSAWRTDPV